MKFWIRVAFALLAASMLAACGTTGTCPAPRPTPNVETTTTCQGFNWGPLRPVQAYLESGGDPVIATLQEITVALEALAEADPVVGPGVDRDVADILRQTTAEAKPMYKAFAETGFSLSELDNQGFLRLIKEVESACVQAGVQMP